MKLLFLEGPPHCRQPHLTHSPFSIHILVCSSELVDDPSSKMVLNAMKPSLLLSSLTPSSRGRWSLCFRRGWRGEGGLSWMMFKGGRGDDRHKSTFEEEGGRG